MGFWEKLFVRLRLKNREYVEGSETLLRDHLYKRNGDYFIIVHHTNNKLGTYYSYKTDEKEAREHVLIELNVKFIEYHNIFGDI